MNYNNKINRLAQIIRLLSRGDNVSTPALIEMFGVTKKIVQTDFKEYLLPLFSDGKIYYDYSLKCYKAKNNFLTKTLLNAEELAIIAILKNKSKDKYCDEDMGEKTDILFDKFESELCNNVYQKSSVEKIDTFKSEIIQIKNAIESKQVIQCFYNQKEREIFPLRILNLEGYWYLIVYEPEDKRIKTFHLNTIKIASVLHKHYEFDEEKIKTFDNAITAYYKPENPPIEVKLFVDKNISRFFIRKPLNPTQRVLTTYNDGSIDIEVVVTDLMELIPTIQKFIPFVAVISPNSLKDEIKQNIQIYMDKFE